MVNMTLKLFSPGASLIRDFN